MPEHVNITDPNLHEPKGAAAASSEQVYKADGAGSGSFQDMFPVTDTFYDDLVVPLTGFNPVGPGTAPGVDATYGTWVFDAATTEVAVMQVQMPHAWKEGTTIKPHIHWRKTTAAAGTVAWRLSYDMAAPGGDFSGSYTTLAIASSPAAGTVDNDTAERHLITALGDIDMTGKTLSTLILFKLERVGASDTYGADAMALSFDVHYQIDSLGSDEEYTK